MRTPDELKALYEEGAGALDTEDLTPLFDEIKTLRARVEEMEDLDFERRQLISSLWNAGHGIISRSRPLLNDWEYEEVDDGYVHWCGEFTWLMADVPPVVLHPRNPYDDPNHRKEIL